MTRYIASVYFQLTPNSDPTLVATIHLPMTSAIFSDIYASINAYESSEEYSDGENVTVYQRYNRTSIAKRGLRGGDFVKLAGQTYIYQGPVNEWTLAD